MEVIIPLVTIRVTNPQPFHIFSVVRRKPNEVVHAETKTILY